MAPGGRRTRTQPTVRSEIPVIPSNSSAITSGTRNVRGRALNKILDAKIKAGMSRPKIVFEPDLARPLGPWSRAFINEVGIICRDFIPLSCHAWTDVDDVERIKLHGHLMKKFDLDIQDPSVESIVNKFFAQRFKDYRCRLHLRYKHYGRQNPYKGLTHEAWVGICDWFDTEDFQNLSIQNSENRGHLPFNHRGGSKPFVIHLENQRNPDTQELPGRIEFYRLMHFSTTKGWISSIAQDNYERMIELKSQDPPEGSSPKTEEEIYEIVCGKRSGYVLGLGHGKIPPSKSSSNNRRDVEEIRQRAEIAERRNEELAAQLHDQGLAIEEMKRWRLIMEANMGPFMSLFAGNSTV